MTTLKQETFFEKVSSKINAKSIQTKDIINHKPKWCPDKYWVSIVDAKRMAIEANKKWLQQKHQKYINADDYQTSLDELLEELENKD